AVGPLNVPLAELRCNVTSGLPQPLVLSQGRHSPSILTYPFSLNTCGPCSSYVLAPSCIQGTDTRTSRPSVPSNGCSPSSSHVKPAGSRADRSTSIVSRSP